MAKAAEKDVPPTTTEGQRKGQASGVSNSRMRSKKTGSATRAFVLESVRTRLGPGRANMCSRAASSCLPMQATLAEVGNNYSTFVFW